MCFWSSSLSRRSSMRDEGWFKNSLTIGTFLDVIIHIGHLHLVPPALNLSILDNGILINGATKQPNLMLDYPMCHVLPLSAHIIFFWGCQVEGTILSKFYIWFLLLVPSFILHTSRFTGGGGWPTGILVSAQGLGTKGFGPGLDNTYSPKLNHSPDPEANISNTKTLVHFILHLYKRHKIQMHMKCILVILSL